MRHAHKGAWLLDLLRAILSDDTRSSYRNYIQTLLGEKLPLVQQCPRTQKFIESLYKRITNQPSPPSLPLPQTRATLKLYTDHEGAIQNAEQALCDIASLEKHLRNHLRLRSLTRPLLLAPKRTDCFLGMFISYSHKSNSTSDSNLLREVIIQLHATGQALGIKAYIEVSRHGKQYRDNALISVTSRNTCPGLECTIDFLPKSEPDAALDIKHSQDPVYRLHSLMRQPISVLQQCSEFAYLDAAPANGTECDFAATTAMTAQLADKAKNGIQKIHEQLFDINHFRIDLVSALDTLTDVVSEIIKNEASTRGVALETRGIESNSTHNILIPSISKRLYDAFYGLLRGVVTMASNTACGEDKSVRICAKTPRERTSFKIQIIASGPQISENDLSPLREALKNETPLALGEAASYINNAVNRQNISRPPNSREQVRMLEKDLRFVKKTLLLCTHATDGLSQPLPGREVKMHLSPIGHGGLKITIAFPTCYLLPATTTYTLNH